ncbi:MAG: hypothetical protein M1837_004515 [Sclerophora amabilis]|nr:MAG: hypothetical protein M1837_004515 [Sclerophora amabilis]
MLSLAFLTSLSQRIADLISAAGSFWDLIPTSSTRSDAPCLDYLFWEIDVGTDAPTDKLTVEARSPAKCPCAPRANRFQDDGEKAPRFVIPSPTPAVTATVLVPEVVAVPAPANAVVTSSPAPAQANTQLKSALSKPGCARKNLKVTFVEGRQEIEVSKWIPKLRFQPWINIMEVENWIVPYGQSQLFFPDTLGVHDGLDEARGPDGDVVMVDWQPETSTLFEEDGDVIMRD